MSNEDMYEDLYDDMDPDNFSKQDLRRFVGEVPKRGAKIEPRKSPQELFVLNHQFLDLDEGAYTEFWHEEIEPMGVRIMYSLPDCTDPELEHRSYFIHQKEMWDKVNPEVRRQAFEAEPELVFKGGATILLGGSNDIRVSIKDVREYIELCLAINNRDIGLLREDGLALMLITSYMSTVTVADKSEYVDSYNMQGYQNLGWMLSLAKDA